MEQDEFLLHTIDVLEKIEIEYAIVGSFASGTYGEPRFTQDVDIVLDLQVEHIEKICEQFPAPDFYLSRSAVEEAVEQRRQFNVIHPSSGNKVDFMMTSRRDDWRRDQLARRRKMKLRPDRSAWFASPEDVILGKLVYYRDGGSEKHLRDITGILKVRPGEIDVDYLAPIAEALDVVDVWKSVLNRLDESQTEPEQRD